MDKSIIDLLNKLPGYISEQILKLYDENNTITEIRLRSGSPVCIKTNRKIICLDSIILLSTDIENIFMTLCGHTVSSYEKQLNNGFITLPGGHRVGVAGKYYQDSKGNLLPGVVTSLNIRIAHKIDISIPEEILNFRKGLLVVGPPHSGKTTFIKNVYKYFSDCNIAVCDERDELFYQCNNCDFISGVNKETAIQWALRTLSPDIIICDEIGEKCESEQILSGTNSGVKFICTVHGDNLSDIYKKPNINILLNAGIFDKVILLYKKDADYIVKEIRNV